MILNNAENLMVGYNQVQSVYLGTSLVWSGSVLPVGYTQLDYIECYNGNQYLNTGIMVGDTTTSKKVFVCDIQLLDISVNTLSFGTANGGNYFLACTNANIDGYIIQSSYIFHNVTGTKDVERHVLTVDFPSSKFYVDSRSISFTKQAVNNELPVSIFRYDGSQRKTSARLYSFKVEDDGELIQNLIPALDPSGVPCVYDTVAHSPIYNSGTGTFGYKKLDGTIVAPT